jgi:hypothetical protein
MSLLSNGALYKGDFNMSGSIFTYIFKFNEFTPTGIFLFNHNIYDGTFLVDSKNGEGRFEQIDADNTKIFYSDPETSFGGIVNLNTGVIEGTAVQAAGLMQGKQGKFKLVFEKFE